MLLPLQAEKSAPAASQAAIVGAVDRSFAMVAVCMRRLDRESIRQAVRLHHGAWALGERENAPLGAGAARIRAEMRRAFPWAAWILCNAGCATSNTIRPDDATFNRAQHRLEETASRVEALDPPPGEGRLFLQAESFYQYRFAFQSHGAMSYLAEGAAAVADLPALQSLAGSLDLVELRLRTYDGAIQLWETLLDRYPDSRLRALTLYRLGWAYRSGAAGGFPHESGDELFELLIKERPDAPLAELSRAAMAVPSKSRGAATAWSLLPGLGQIYVGETANGLVRLGITAVSLAMIVVPGILALERREELSWSKNWPLLAIGLAGLVSLSIDYTAAYQDAMRGVVEFNERREAEFQARRPEAL